MKNITNPVSAVIKVSVDTGCYRVIKISLNKKLTDLADSILDSFEFDHDHLYSFFMSNKAWDESSEYTLFPEDNSVNDAADFKLSDFGLDAGRLFKFLYDFGDEWMFQCRVLELSDQKVTKTTVTESKGNAPEQYPDYDDEDDWDDDDDYDDKEYGEMTPEMEEKCGKKNKEMLEKFRESLSSFTPKTIENHVSNADFFINDFLLERCGLAFEDGIGELYEFLGNYFIRKCLWSTPGTIKSTAASIKKFYKCMMEIGEIDKEDYRELCDIIKENMPLWQDKCAQYNDIDNENPFAFLFD